MTSESPLASPTKSPHKFKWWEKHFRSHSQDRPTEKFGSGSISDKSLSLASSLEKLKLTPVSDEKTRSPIFEKCHKTGYVCPLEIYDTSFWSNIKSDESFYFSPATKPKLTTVPPVNLTFKENILHQALNVETLEIGQNQRIVIDSHDRLFLPAVKYLSIHSDCSYDTPWTHSPTAYDTPHHVDQQRRQAIYRILIASPNLQLIRDFHFDTDFSLVMAAGKIHCVQRLCLLLDTININHLMDYISTRPHLSILQLIDVSEGGEVSFEKSHKLSLALRLLFLSTFDTLRILDLTQFCSHIDLQFPHAMAKLHQLTLGSVTDPFRPSRLLPCQLHVDEIFPNLRVLDCSRLQSDENNYWDLYFPLEHPFYGQFDKVKVLVISDQMSFFFMEKIKHQLCPNFIKLVVDSQGKDGLSFMMIKIFRYWRHLEHLELRLKDLPSLGLDSVLTGLQEETCQRLRNFGKEAGHEHDRTIISMQDKEPSIANMSKLKTLEIILGHDCLSKIALLPEYSTERPLVSFVSQRYGFSQLPQLKVVITFDQHCPWGLDILPTFQSLVSPQVTLMSKRDRCCCRPNED